jgi:hypothetical protein
MQCSNDPLPVNTIYYGLTGCQIAGGYTSFWAVAHFLPAQAAKQADI